MNGIRKTNPQRESIRKQIRCDVPVFFGYDEKDEIADAKKKGQPFLYVDHAYFHRGYQTGNFRALYSTIHRTNILDLPDDRREMFHVKLREWQEGGDFVLFIPAPPNPLWFHRENKWNEDALDLLCKSTKREVRVKPSKTNGLGDSIKQCFALATHSSVAGVEAACAGIKVCGPKTSPAYPIGVELHEVDKAITPNRDAWVNTLTYSQFTTAELKDGSAWQIIKETERL